MSASEEFCLSRAIQMFALLLLLLLWPLEGFGGHLGRHLVKKLFQGSDFGKLLVCCKVHYNLTESIEKPFVANFFGVKLYFDWTIS